MPINRDDQRIIQQIWRMAASAEQFSDLDRLCIDQLCQLGVDWYSLFQLRTPEGHFRPQLILGDLDHPWSRHYLFHKYFHDDPINRSVLQNQRWFCWSALQHEQRLSARGQKVFDEARVFGLTDGLVVPIRLLGVDQSLLVFAAAGARLETGNRPLMASLAALLMYIHSRARNLLAEADIIRGAGPVAFSHSQLDVIVRVSEGMDYRIIARELGVTAQAIKQRMAYIRSLIGADKNEEVVAYAVSTGQIFPPIKFSDYTRVYVKGVVESA